MTYNRRYIGGQIPVGKAGETAGMGGKHRSGQYRALNPRSGNNRQGNGEGTFADTGNIVDSGNSFLFKHGAFTGIAIGVLLGVISPLVSLVAFSIIFSLLITYIKSKSTASTDTIIGVFSSTAIAAGLMKVTTAENGREAVEKFLAVPEGTYQYILMDLQMPVLDGYEATRQIRAVEHPEAKRICIIAVTADVFPEDIARASACGMMMNSGIQIPAGGCQPWAENHWQCQAQAPRKK